MSTFKINRSISVTGRGTMVFGHIVDGSLKRGDTVFIHSKSKMIAQTVITSILNNRESLESIDMRHKSFEIGLSLRGVDHKRIEAGMTLSDSKNEGSFNDDIKPSSGEQSIGVLENFFDAKKGTIEPFLKDVTVGTTTTFNQDFVESALNAPFWNPMSKKLGVTLQGGGAKGAFGVGALHFLVQNQIIRSTKQLYISSASTGSLTSLILAENSNQQVSDKMLNQYMSLFNVKDMFVIREDVRKILKESSLLQDAVKEALVNGTFVPDIGDEVNLVNITSTVINKLSAAILPDWLYNVDSKITGYLRDVFGVETKNLEAFFKALKKLLEVRYSLAKLEPVRNSLRDPEFGVNAELIKNLNSRLWMAVTSYNSGVVAYITEKGELLYPKETDNPNTFDYENYERYKIEMITDPDNSLNSGVASDHDMKEMLINGALASGAFPTFFPPMRITYFDKEANESRSELFIDGGVKENLPLNILTNPKMRPNDTADLQNIVAIYCSNFGNNVNPIGEPVKILDPALTAAKLTLNEIDRTDFSHGKSLNVEGIENDRDDTNVLHIWPLVPTLGLTEVIPFKIQATIWYGYMRGYDEAYIAQHKPEIQQRTELRYNSTSIFTLYKKLYEQIANLIAQSAYFINVVEDEKVVKREFVSKKDLTNSHRIQTMAFHLPSLKTYLKVKVQIMKLIIKRLELTKEKGAPEKSVMRGEFGFMQKCFYTDWLGVYEYLNSYDIAINKRRRLKSVFRKLFMSSEKDFEVITSKKNGEIKVARASKVDAEVRDLIRQIESNLFAFDGSNVLIDQIILAEEKDDNARDKRFVNNSNFF